MNRFGRLRSLLIPSSAAVTTGLCWVLLLLLGRSVRAFSVRPTATRLQRLHTTSLYVASESLSPSIAQSLQNSRSDDRHSLSEDDDLLPSSSPVTSSDGITHILNAQQHETFLQENRDKLVILKIYAPWCKACKGLEPKFASLVHGELYANLPLSFCDLSIQNNKQFVKDLGVIALPSIQFYVGGRLDQTFPCGPSKFPILKRKLAQLINDHVDAKTRLVKESSLKPASPENVTMASVVFNDTQTAVAPSVASPKPASVVSHELKRLWVSRIPYFAELSLADLDQVISKAKEWTFEAGTILMRQGRPGRTFYVLTDGEVEICQQTMTDPLVFASDAYLGTVIKHLGPGDYFGERALITGEPRAASIRASERVQCWAFDRDDFPASSVLSGRTRNAADVDLVNDKYGVQLDGTELGALLQLSVMQQVREASTASQIRGSVNSPQPIIGVDTDEDFELVEDEEEGFEIVEDSTWAIASPESSSKVQDTAASPGPSVKSPKDVVTLLTRFQMIRSVSQCVNYIIKTGARWGDDGIRRRRSILISLLTPAQRRQILDTFSLIDLANDGTISLLELKRVMESIGEIKSEDELRLISKGHGVLTLTDFLGIMAEAEFYQLFRDIFASLDVNDTGFVRAQDLNRVLGGVQDLLTDDSKKIIELDDEDSDMLIDYDQFSRMLLGSALL